MTMQYIMLWITVVSN